MVGLLGMAVLWKYQGWIIFGVAVWLWSKVWRNSLGPWLRDRRLTKRAEEAALQLRADRENRQWLEAGLYEGHYPAPTLPLTGVHEPRAWYDYDDGLTEWP